MSERPVPTHEVRELARAFDGIARTLRQGAPDSEYVKGLAAMASVSAQSLYMLAAVGSAKEVTIPDPEYTVKENERG